MELISVIVPIYKVEKFLNKSLDSIINQTYKNLEIILVDDGSPDNCGKICDEYAKRDERIKVIHKENGGVSSARNAGLDAVTGEYISFIDPDDYVSENFIEILYNILKKNSVDIVECDFIKFENEPVLESVSDELEIISSLEMQKRIYSDFNLRTIVLWNKLYVAKIFDDLRFPLGRINEDEALIPSIIYNAKNNIAISNLKLYYYRFNPKSIMGKKFNPSRLDILLALNERKEFYKNIGQQELYNNATISYQYILRRNYIFCMENIDDAKKYLEQILFDARENYKEYSKIKNISIRERIREKLFITCPNFFYRIMKLKAYLRKR